MGIISWIIFGLIVGVIANYIDPQAARGGLIGTIILGIVGGLVGGFLSSMITGVGVTGFNLTSLVIAVAGALVLLVIGRALNRA
jgi:uncharacterized membrane protein YeaQ/YmgE (transglycosylase-associated protein family)